MLNPNLRNTMKTDLSKRYDAFIKEEMAEHKKIIDDYHKEIQVLRDSVDTALKQGNDLYRHAEQQYKDKTLVLENLINNLTVKTQVHDIDLSDKKNTLLAIYNTIHEWMDIFIKKSEFDQFKKHIDFYLIENKVNHDRNQDIFYKSIRESIDDLKKELHKTRETFDTKINELNEKIDNKFSLCVMDKEGVTNEIRIYKKDVFIIQKKIENLYTLIERINKRFETICHKQAQ